MQFTTPKHIKEDDSIIWICGKQNQLTMKFRDDVKVRLAKSYYPEGKLDTTYRENIIQLTKNTAQAEIEEVFKEPPFFGDKYLLLGDLSDLDNRPKRRLLNLLSNSPKHIIAVVFISNYRDYKQLADNDKFNAGKAIYLFRISHNYYKEYARAVLKKEISDKALNIYIKRTDNYSNFIFYLDKLKQLPAPIRSDEVKKHIPHCSTYDLDDYLKTLILGNKKTVHMKALEMCIKTYRRKTYDTILDALEVMMDIKKLTLRGYLLSMTAKEDIEYLEETKMLPPSLEKLNIHKIRDYLEITSAISITELHLIYLCFLKTKPNTHNLYILTDIIYNRNETRQLIGSICQGKLKL